MATMPKSITRHGIGGLVLAASIAMSLLLAAIGVFAIQQSSSLHDRLDAVTTRDLTPLMKLRLAQNDAFNVTISDLVKASTDDPVVIAAMDEEIAMYGGRVIPGLEDTIAASPPEMRGAVEALVSGWEAFAAAAAEYEENPNSPNASELMDAANAQYGQVMGDFDALVEQFADDAAAQREAVDGAYRTLLITTILAISVGGVIAITVGLAIARSIRRRARVLVAATDQLADGDFTQEVPGEGADELGRMTSALNRASARLKSMIGSVAASATTLRGSSDHLDDVSRELSQSSETTGSRATSVASTADEVSRNVQTVAAASEEMMASVSEISRNASDAAKVAQTAVTVAGEAGAVVTRLSDSSTQITSVIKLITSIAEQTNLLALNATIEASRAGEAGKGFAVVANEVKDLAQETARATDEISRQIQSVQADAQRAVATIEQVTDVISQINDYTAGIASAVEEQTATTSEMARNISAAADGVTAIAGGASDVTSSAQSTGGLVTQSRAASSELASMSTSLADLVGAFRY